MKVLCVGDDPAGLYFALHLKRRKPDMEVSILETPSGFNPYLAQLASFGSKLAPPEGGSDLRALLEPHLLTSEGICVRRNEERRIVEGFVCCFIDTASLWSALKRTAADLGCQFLESADRMGAQADVVVVADGAASKTREAEPERFGVTRETGVARSFVFALERGVERAAHVFATGDRGSFHMSLSPARDGARATVEISESVFRRSGLDAASSEESARLLSQIFEFELGGQMLRPLSRAWSTFVAISNRTWRVENRILVGAAAYDIHFSHPLALRAQLEDAEAIAAALAETPGDQALDQVLNARRGRAESLARAARASQTWCEHLDRYLPAPFEQFAFSCLTRSMRVNHSDWRAMAPSFVRAVDRSVCADERNEPSPPMMAPFELRGMRLANRIAVSPMCMYSAVDGEANDFHLVHLGSRAIGGAGLVLTEMTDVSPEGRISLYCAGMYAPKHVSAWRRITDFIHARSGAKVGVQLAHAGRKGSLSRSWEGHKALDKDQGWELLAPSAVPFEEGRNIPKEMTLVDMRRIVDAFAAAAKMSDEAGFDMIELHMAHGYLLSSFISPLSNRRADAYGGSLDRRLKFPLEVLRAVRSSWPQAKPISVRISATDWIDGGTTVQDAIVVSQRLCEAGADIITASTGGVTAERRPAVGRLYQATFSDQIRNELRIPTMAVGGLASYGDCNTMIAAGRADVCALARGYLNDPYFVRHAAQKQGYKGLKWPNEYRGADQVPILDC